jgi:hypothetical protein
LGWSVRERPPAQRDFETNLNYAWGWRLLRFSIHIKTRKTAPPPPPMNTTTTKTAMSDDNGSLEP